jgi:hypothetical protein
MQLAEAPVVQEKCSPCPAEKGKKADQGVPPDYNSLGMGAS